MNTPRLSSSSASASGPAAFSGRRSLRWRRHFFRALLSLVALLAITLVLAPRAGRATPPDDPNVPPNPTRDLVGLWQGTFQSAVTPELQGDVVLDITAQQHRRFAGSISAGVLTPVDPCKGILTASNHLHMVSESGGGKVHAHGQLVENVLFLQYRAVLADGSVDHGTMTLVGDFGDTSVDSP